MSGFLAFLLSGFLAVMFQSSVLEAQEKTFTNDLGMEFTLIPAGSFMMGGNPDIEEAAGDEEPRHQVHISQPFYLGVYEVTQEQWAAVMGSNPSKFQGLTNPVEQVSWADVQFFIEQLNEKESHGKYRLPTEAEWEYAARAGTDTAFFFGNDPGAYHANDSAELGQYAWHDDMFTGKAHPVGQKLPNPWGLYDIYGNVYEWVEDWYGEEYYASGPATDPKGPSSGSGRVYRGGGWGDRAWFSRSASRNSAAPDTRYASNGFRLAFSPGETSERESFAPPPYRLEDGRVYRDLTPLDCELNEVPAEIGGEFRYWAAIDTYLSEVVRESEIGVWFFSAEGEILRRVAMDIDWQDVSFSPDGSAFVIQSGTSESGYVTLNVYGQWSGKIAEFEGLMDDLAWVDNTRFVWRRLDGTREGPNYEKRAQRSPDGYLMASAPHTSIVMFDVAANETTVLKESTATQSFWFEKVLEGGRAVEGTEHYVEFEADWGDEDKEQMRNFRIEIPAAR